MNDNGGTNIGPDAKADKGGVAIGPGARAGKRGVAIGAGARAAPGQVVITGGVNITGNYTDDAHPQYFRRDGVRTMGNDPLISCPKCGGWLKCDTTLKKWVHVAISNCDM